MDKNSLFSTIYKNTWYRTTEATCENFGWEGLFLGGVRSV